MPAIACPCVAVQAAPGMVRTWHGPTRYAPHTHKGSANPGLQSHQPRGDLSLSGRNAELGASAQLLFGYRRVNFAAWLAA